MQNEWRDFNGGAWENEVNVRDFIQRNYKPYDGDSSFLEGPTEDTTALWQDVLELSKQEREAGGVLDMDTKIISTITSHGPAYLDKDKEKIVGFQTDKPFKRSLQPYGGIRMAIKACEDNGYKVDPEVVEYFTTHRKTHNAGVFDAYTPEMRACRSAHIITGLPDAYGRGRIIGDYRRPALYGVDRLIADKEEQLESTRTIMYSDVIREREELSEQIRALKMLKELAKIYGCDISKPATNVLEATQAVYFAYLAAVKEQNGAAMSLGRTSTFLDIYAERDLREGTFTEKEIQEIIPHRHPFLLIDCIEEVTPGEGAVGYKNVTYNEPWFAGHFPQEPVMPGVLIVEALAQVGAVAILSEEGNKGRTAYFGAINNAKFKKKVVPGDKLKLECHIIKRKGPVGIGSATATVDGKLAVSAELTFMIG